jgi:peptidoglycan DL-endopeptidase CwlO
VALYLGGGRIMGAQQTGVPLGVRPVSFTEKGLVPLATRPGTAPPA